MKNFMALLKEKFKYLTKDGRPLKKRIPISAAVHLFSLFTIVFNTPVEVYLTNITDFDFSFTSLLLVMGTATVVLTALGTALSLILKGRLFNYYVTLVFSLSLCGYIQGNFLNKSVPSLDGNAVAWHDMTALALINLVIWAVCFIIPFIVHFISRDFWKKAVIFLSCALVFMQVISLGMIAATTDFSKYSVEGYYSKDNLYEVSDDGDTIVLILDYFDNEYMDLLLEEEPDILNEWTGFTRFANCTGMYKQTMPSIAYLLTATEWKCQTSAWDFSPTAFESSDFLGRIDRAGHEINLYVSGTANSSVAYSLADNYSNATPSINPLGMLKSMLTHTLYRNMPIIAKSVFWHYTDDISNASVKTGTTLKSSPYVINDPSFFSGLKDNGLTASENGRAFRFVHMRGAHSPYEMDENGIATGDTDAVRQRKGSVFVVSQYLRRMKENGTYDKSTIIIMADHGAVEIADEMSRAALPILFVKPANADSSSAFTTSYAPVSQKDFHATVLWALGDKNYSDYGRTFFEIPEDEDRVRNFYFRIAYDGSPDESLIEYEINGDARDFSNWKLTENRWGD